MISESGQMESHREQASPDALAEPKRVATDVIAASEQAARSIAGSSPASPTLLERLENHIAGMDLHQKKRFQGKLLIEAKKEIERLRGAIIAHHSQRADDRCIEDDDRLYEAANLTACDRRVGDKAAMLANCARFIDQRCEGGHWPSYADLEARIKALEMDQIPIGGESKNQPFRP